MTTSFGPNHYVPVLKLKRAEARAMVLLDASIRADLTPLFEVVELDDADGDDDSSRGRNTIDQHIEKAIAYLTEVVEKGKVKRYFLDCQSIASEGTEAVRALFERVKTLDAWCVPITGISRADDGAVELAAREPGASVALRLTRNDLSEGRVKRELLPWVKAHALSPAGVDVILDLGAVGDMVEDGVQSEAERFLAALPTPLAWRTLTMSAVAFPAGGIETNSTTYKQRLDWRVWRDHVHANRHSLVRLPTFSDGGIQHPKGVENIPPEFLVNFSPSIRYATEDDWLLIKGVGRQNQAHKDQFPGMASELVKNTRFMGANHCEGCAGAERAAQGKPNLGSQEVWLRLGAIHHLTLAVEQLRSLPEP